MPLPSSPGIPPELWRQIFFDVYAVQRRDLPFVNSIDASLFPWVAARVSREWRAICLADWCRELWAQVSIEEEFATRLVKDYVYNSHLLELRAMPHMDPESPSPMPNDKPRAVDELENRLKTQLDFAGGFPLTVTLDMDNQRAQDKIMKVLWPYRSIWKLFRAEQTSTFKGTGNWDTTFENYCDSLQGSTEVHFPNLTSIWFSYSSKRARPKCMARIRDY